MEISRRTAYISGHLDLTPPEFEKHYIPKILEAIARGDRFIVCDARGTDRMAQEYLNMVGQLDVTVYHMLDTPRNHVAVYKTVGGFQQDHLRDRAATENSDYDIAWVKPGREASGTARNIERRTRTTETN
jgi:hypothetical protein